VACRSTFEFASRSFEEVDSLDDPLIPAPWPLCTVVPGVAVVDPLLLDEPAVCETAKLDASASTNTESACFFINRYSPLFTFEGLASSARV
jgi:hypothetical protein